MDAMLPYELTPHLVVKRIIKLRRIYRIIIGSEVNQLAIVDHWMSRILCYIQHISKL